MGMGMGMEMEMEKSHQNPVNHIVLILIVKCLRPVVVVAVAAVPIDVLCQIARSKNCFVILPLTARTARRWRREKETDLRAWKGIA